MFPKQRNIRKQKKFDIFITKGIFCFAIKELFYLTNLIKYVIIFVFIFKSSFLFDKIN